MERTPQASAAGSARAARAARGSRAEAAAGKRRRRAKRAEAGSRASPADTGQDGPRRDLQEGEVVELEIERLAIGGDGVGRKHGWVVFVPRAAPGDRLRVELVRVRRRHARARLLEVLVPGPDRRDPPCVYAARCGGCGWMHLGESAQERARLALVRDALERIGGLRELPSFEEIRSSRALGYRARARVACAEGRVGFRAAGSREVVDVERCLVLDAPTQAALEELRATPPSGAVEVELQGFREEVRVGGHAYHVPKGAFFQPNGALWEAWLAAVEGACGVGGLAVELYAGVGFYTVALARRFERVVAVERGAEALALARNAGPRVRVLRAAAERWAPAELAALAPDLVLLNPPRGGARAEVCAAIAGARPARVVYVSCEPSTLARDVARLSAALRVTRVAVLHALPQTPHVEAICTLELLTPRRSAS